MALQSLNVSYSSQAIEGIRGLLNIAVSDILKHLFIHVLTAYSSLLIQKSHVENRNLDSIELCSHMSYGPVA